MKGLLEVQHLETMKGVYSCYAYPLSGVAAKLRLVYMRHVCGDFLDVA